MLQNNFAKNVMMIAGGTAFAQIIGMISSPIISRIYLPSEFGVFTVFISILGVISYLGTLSYESAVPIADDDTKAINVLSFSFVILAIISFLLLLVIFFGGDFFLEILNATNLKNYKYLIVIGFIMTGIYTILESWALRFKNYKVIAKTKYSQSILGNGGKIALSLLQFGPNGLIFGQILGQSAGIINLFIPLVKDQAGLLKSINIWTMWWCAKRYVRFPIYSSPTILIISLTSQLPVFFLSAFYSSVTVGLYGLALMITFFPMSLIGKSVQDVFYSEAASLGKSNPFKIKKLSRSILRKMSLIGAVPMIILITSGPFLFTLVFGDKWYNAGIFSSILTIYAYSYFIFQPISTVFSIFEEQHIQFYLNIAKVVLVIIVFFIANTLGLKSVYAILLFSIAMGTTEIAKYLLAQYVLNKHISKTKESI